MEKKAPVLKKEMIFIVSMDEVSIYDDRRGYSPISLGIFLKWLKSGEPWRK